MSGWRFPALLLVLGLTVGGAACASGDDDQLERVPIRRLDVTGVQLSFADFFDPPFLDQYPEVAAEVNGHRLRDETSLPAR